MRKSHAVVEGYKAEERKSKLDETRTSYAAKMTEAPAAGRKAAIEWVKELNRSWDRRQADATTSRLARLKNAVLKACGKTAAEAGFLRFWRGKARPFVSNDVTRRQRWAPVPLLFW